MPEMTAYAVAGRTPAPKCALMNDNADALVAQIVDSAKPTNANVGTPCGER